MEEESIIFDCSGTFYNPKMRLCRSISSLVVGAIGEPLDVVDCFSASGIRGIRYAEENDNVSSLTFCDLDEIAIQKAKANYPNAKAVHGNISKEAFNLCGNFVELDPFGSPAPYLIDGMRILRKHKIAYLSVTATDVAVLCGGKKEACMKNYHAVPLNNEFTHEIGTRILLKRIVEVAAEFNYGVFPLLSFSHQHYIKIIVKLVRSADLAYKSLSNLGHISYCSFCGYRSYGLFPTKCFCNKSKYAGPLWFGNLHDVSILSKAIVLNSERNYSDKRKLHSLLSIMVGENSFPPFYYQIPYLFKLLKLGEIPSYAKILSELNRSSRAVRTHFSPTAIKTDLSYKDLFYFLQNMKK